MRPRSRERELALGDEAQVGAADGELGPHDLERAPVVGQRLRQDLLAVARRELGGQRGLYFAERPQADCGVGRDRLLLFRACGSRPGS